MAINRDFDQEYVWPADLLDDLNWWSSVTRPISVSFEAVVPDFYLVTDASEYGWGAICQDEEIYGAWDVCDTRSDIAVL